MPRRIPDYPDAFAGWNLICSLGSFLSVISTCLFLYIIYNAFTAQNIKPKEYKESKSIKKFLPWSQYLFLLTQFDAPEKWQMNFQDPATPIMEKIIDLHHDIQFFLIIIVITVLWLLLRAVYLFNDKNTFTKRFSFSHHTQLELIWTIIPTIILVFIAIPSFALLYAIDELHNPQITLKVIGNQWYWSYEFSDYIIKGPEDTIKIDSYMVLEEDLAKGQLRLLEVDERILLPERVSIRILVTSRDVIHSWAIPSLGVKMDACPGRLNQVGVFIRRTGVYFGQCSELCGINHAFMPIVVEGVTLEDYKNWLTKKASSPSHLFLVY
jgi:cytochrome c oxidase subunit 2